MNTTTNTTSWVLDGDAGEEEMGKTWATKYFAGTTLTVSFVYSDWVNTVSVQVMNEEYRGRKGNMKANDLLEAFAKANAWIKRHKIGQNG